MKKVNLRIVFFLFMLSLNTLGVFGQKVFYANRYYSLGGSEVIDLNVRKDNSFLVIYYDSPGGTNNDFYFSVMLNDSLKIYDGRLFDGDLPYSKDKIPLKVTSDQYNNIYITGFYKDSVDLGNGNYLVGSDMQPFLFKFNSTGTVQWGVNLMGYVEDIAVNDSGYIYVTDRNHYSNAFYPKLHYFPPVTQKISPAGTVAWSDTINYGSHVETVNNVIVLAGDTLIALSDNDSLLWKLAIKANDIIGHSGNILLGNDSILSSYDSTGVQVWSLPLAVTCLTARPENNNIYIGQNDSLLVLDSVGQVVWYKQGIPAAELIGASSDGKVYITGTHEADHDWVICPFYFVKVFDFDGINTYTNDCLLGIQQDTSGLPTIYNYFWYSSAYDYIWSGGGYNTFCQGDPLSRLYNDNGCFDAEQYGIYYQVCGQFNTGNQFLRLLDDNPAFNSPDTMYSHTIPVSFPPGPAYYKVVSTNPIVESNVYQFNVSGNSKLSISAYGPTSFCIGNSTILHANNQCNLCWYYNWFKNGNYINSSNSPILTVTAAGVYSCRDFIECNENGECDAHFPSDSIIVTTPCIRIRHHIPSQERNAEGTAEEESLIEVYPNPFYGSTDLYVDDLSSIKSLSIFSVDGRLISKHVNINYNQIKLGEDLLPGIYYLHFETMDGAENIPIVKM